MSAATASPLPPESSSVPLGLYLHVPFCAVTCDFCAFYQKRPEKGDFRRFVDGIRRELYLAAPDRPVQTVFWGGGTPGLLPPEYIRELGTLIRDRCGDRPVEWSVELTPEAARDARLEALSAIGVNRISLGVQSFQPRLLEAMGRRSSREAVMEAFSRLRRHGFGNINLDLIFAFPGQTEMEWESDLREAAALEPEHLSTYCLTFEEDTALWVKLARGEFVRDEEREAVFFGMAEKILPAYGLNKYETSNYARSGYECRHNLNTWRMAEWIGLGPAAASQFRGWRGANPPDIEKWSSELAAGRRSAEDRIALSDGLLAADLLIFGLRLTRGVSPSELEARFPGTVTSELRAFLDRLRAEGLARKEDDGRFCLTARGRLLVDRIGAEILERME